MFKVLDFSAIFQFALIFDHFPEMGREKSGTFLAPPLHKVISYAHLRNIWSGFCQNRGLFIPLYYIHNARFENVKRKSEIFQKNFL